MAGAALVGVRVPGFQAAPDPLAGQQPLPGPVDAGRMGFAPVTQLPGDGLAGLIQAADAFDSVPAQLIVAGSIAVE